MCLLLFTGIVLLSLASPTSSDDFAEHLPPECRQFDFWIGEWRVENRFLQSDASWKTGGEAKARITAVLGGAAIFEQWRGELHGRTQLGFSLRAFDPELERWNLLLFWPGAKGIGRFGTLKGHFRHGRGELFSQRPGEDGATLLSRYTFSDTLPETMRWDSATSDDGGQTWRTSWIMEFTRTAPASARRESQILEPWIKGDVPAPELADQSDFWLGEWQGSEERLGEDGQWTEAKLIARRAKILSDTLLIGFEDAVDAAGHTERRLIVGAYVEPQEQWEWWWVDDQDLRFGSVSGNWSGSRFTGETRREGPPTRWAWQRDSDDAYTLEIFRRSESGEWQVRTRQRWER